jgi:hypothetical protein
LGITEVNSENARFVVTIAAGLLRLFSGDLEQELGAGLEVQA